MSPADRPTDERSTSLEVQHAELGRCPECNAPIRTSSKLIEYTTETGISIYAECPHCLDVVHPG